MKKVIKITTFKKQLQDDAEFWAKKSYKERFLTVEILREQFHGAATKQRLQRVLRVTRKA